jgi:flagellar basal body rod protein FlgC
MSDPLSIAVSGLNNAALRISNAASNIVKASSTMKGGKNYSGTSVVSSPNGMGGVDSQIVPRTGGAQIDLASELVDSAVASFSYQADAKVIEAVAADQKKLIDAIA